MLGHGDAWFHDMRVSVLTQQVYTNIRKFKEDLGRYPPHHFVCVPLVLHTLYGRVSAAHTRSLPLSHAFTLMKVSNSVGCRSDYESGVDRTPWGTWMHPSCDFDLYG